MLGVEVPGPEIPEEEKETDSQREQLDRQSDKSSLGQEFSEKEKQDLGFLKHQTEVGKIGGPEDKPSEGRKFVTHPELPPGWKSISPDLREKFLEKFGKKIDNEDYDEVLLGIGEMSGEEIHKAAGVMKKMLIGQMTGEVKDPSYGEGFFTNIDRGSTKEMFYRLLQKFYPSTGVEVREDATDRRGKPLKDDVSVWIEK